MRSYFYLLPFFATTPVFAQPAPSIAPAKPQIQIDAKAVELLDKTAKYYGSLRSLKIVTRGSSTWEGETLPINLTLFFERPNRVRAQGEADGTKSVVVADGKTLFLWDDLVDNPVKRAQNDRYTEPWRNLMGTADYFVADYFSDWLFGQHWLRPLQTQKVEINIDVFEAKVLPSRLINGAPAEGVQLQATRNARGKEPKFLTLRILWFRPDGRLVRAEQINDFGAKVKRKTVDVVAARTNLALPSSTWALKK